MANLLHEVRGLTATLVDGAPMAGREETELVDLLTEMERLKSALTAAQADAAVALDLVVRAREAEHGVAADRRGRGVAAQVALARQESPHRGQVLLGLARELATALPHTRQALREGRLNEFRAMIVARETGGLDAERRAEIDEVVCGDADLLAGLGTRCLAGELRRRVAAADPAAVVRRHARAVTERAVSVRPAPDGMAYLTALLPLTQAVACYAGLRREADALRATADPRGRGQAMADLLVERVTGQTRADQVPVAVTLVMSDEALLGAGTDPAVVPGHGPVPAQIARESVARASASLQAWIRRLYADPTGDLVALTSKRRLAPDGLAAYLEARDQGLCRTPWCDAPVRHLDHVEPHHAGGATIAGNLQGLCESCNHAKQAPGWHQRQIPDDPLWPSGRHTVETTTPTGHRHRSRAPAPPSPARHTRPTMEIRYLPPGMTIELALGA